MAEIKRINSNPIIDYMARDYESLLKAMRDQIPSKLPEWTDYKSEADFGNVLLQLFAHMGDILSYYQDRIANESFLGTAQSRSSIIHHLRLIGYRLSTAAPASADLTLILPAECDGIITIKRGDAFATKSRKDKPSVRFEYTREEDLTIDCSTLEVVNNKKYYRSIPVEEGRLIKEERLGVSDGTPNQKFPLAHADLILRSLGEGQKVNRDVILMTELKEVIDEWTLQESLAFSRDEKDFIVEIDEENRVTLIFGDGDFGEIPSSGSEIKVTYRVGGGIKGNVPEGSIETIVNAPDLALLGAKITNEESATGGAERESIEHAVMHAPRVFRSLKRAITADDYKALALDFKGVGKVRVEAGNWNKVTLFIAPQGGGYASDVLRANLLAYFEDKRPVSTIIEIEDVDYVKIYVEAVVGVSSYYAKETIKEKVEEAGGSLLSFDNVDFAQIIYLSKFYEALEAIEGVEYANIREFRREGQKERIEPSGKIELGNNEIPRIPDEPGYAGGIKVVFPEDEE
ncbi:MAG: baseplate J/gp47 family protein [bacterium]